MGFNISGLAINKNYEKDFELLQQELGWNLEKHSEIDFETASSDWIEDEICDVYFSENGTLILMGMEMCTDSYPLKNDHTLTFALSESSMSFFANYCENGIEKRSMLEVEDEKITDEGEKLEVENETNDTSEIILNQLKKVIGKGFWDIDPNEKVVRYTFTKNIETPSFEETIFDINRPISQEDLSEKFSDEDLFEYFDKIIEFAQTNQINAFLIPWSHGDESRKFMNLFAIITEILNRPHLSEQINQRMPVDRFKLLCRFDSDKIDSKTADQMMKELAMINNQDGSYSINNVEQKKWWEFWK